MTELPDILTANPNRSPGCSIVRAACSVVRRRCSLSIDTLSDVLQAVRLKGAVFFDVETSSPWVADQTLASQFAYGFSFC